MNQVKWLNVKKWIRRKKPKAVRIILTFVLVALVLTYVSRFTSSILIPQVECGTPESGSIAHKIFTQGTIESGASQKEYSITTVMSSSFRPYVKEGDVAQVYSYDLSKNVEAGVVSIQQDTEDSASYNVTLKAPAKGFHVGMMVDVTFEHNSKKYDYVLPWSAIRSGADNSNYILVTATKSTILGDAMVAKRVGVKVEDSNETECAVSSSGLSPEDEVILVSDKNVEAGDSIRLTEK